MLLRRQNVEEASTETADQWSDNVGVCVVIEVSVTCLQVVREHQQLVSGQSDGYSWVEARTELVSGSDDSHKSQNDAHCGSDAFAIACSVLALDHKDDADKDKGADDLVREHLQVH